MNSGKKRYLPVFLICFLIMAGRFFITDLQAEAAVKAADAKQTMQIIKKSIKNGNNTIKFTASEDYSAVQIQNMLEDAAVSQGMVLSGNTQISKTAERPDRVEYIIELSDDALMKVKILRSRSDAVKAAAEELKNARYANYYSEVSYYEVFERMLQQHPEYNYDTSIWRSSNGAYGYRRSSSLTEKQQKKLMSQADNAASGAVKKCIRAKMTDKQKAKAVHNYIIKNCRYARYQNSFTAYGALAEGNAVCQGYAAAFNLMASKCGLQSMAVCGTTRGGAHAWTYVKIGKKYRYIDCTWDDTDTLGKGIVYTYFNVKADKMKEEHVWNEADFPSSDIKYCKYFK